MDARQYTGAKEVLDVGIQDITVIEEQEIADCNDKILVLSLTCANYKSEGHNIENLPQLHVTMVSSRPTTIPFLIWESTIQKLFYLYIMNGFNKGYTNTRQDQELWNSISDDLDVDLPVQNLWNGLSALPIAHINNYEFKKDNITLWRFFTNRIDYSETGMEHETLYKLNITNDSIKSTSTNTIINGISLIKKNYSDLSSIGIKVLPLKTNNISFNADTSCNEDKLNGIKNDKNFFRVKVDERGNKVKLLTKNRLSNDLDIKLECSIDRIYTKDIYIDEEFTCSNEIGTLLNPEASSGGLTKFKVSIPYGDYYGKLVNKTIPIKGASTVIKKDIKDINEYISNKFSINRIENRYGYLYIYFDKVFDFKELNIAINGFTTKFIRREIIHHTDPMIISKRIDYNTEFEFDIINRLYTYTLDITEGEIDNNYRVNFELTPDIKIDNILSVTVENQKLIIVSNSKLCTKDGIPNCTIKCVNTTHSYDEINDIYNDSSMFRMDFDISDIKTDANGAQYIRYDFDSINSQYYKNYGSLENYWFSYETKSINISKNISVKKVDIEDDNIFIYISNSEVQAFNDTYILSDIQIQFDYYYIKPVLHPNNEYRATDTFKIDINHDTIYYRDSYENGYYIYTFSSYYEYLPGEYPITKKEISFYLNDGTDMVYDVGYDNGSVAVYLFQDRVYDYTNIDLSFYVGEFTQIYQENYETYRFITDKARQKFIRMMYCLNWVKKEFEGYTIPRLIQEVNDM